MKKPICTASAKQSALSALPKVAPTDEGLVLINPRKVPLTPEVLKTLSGFAETSDEEALDICHTSLTLAHLLLDFLARKAGTFIDNQEVVDLNSKQVASVVKMSRSKSKPRKNKAA